MLATEPATPEGNLADDHAQEGAPVAVVADLAAVAPWRRELRTIAVFAVAVGLLNLATPVVVSELVNTVMFSVVAQPLVVLSLALMFCLGLAAAMQGLQVYVAEFVQQRLFVRVVAAFAERIPKLRVDGIGRAHAPELVNRFFDVLTVQKAAALLVLDGLAIGLQTVIGLTVLGFYHWALLGYDLALILALFFLVFVLGAGAVKSAIRKSRAKYAAAAWLEEIARHPRVFKTGGGPGYGLHRADILAGAYVEARRAHFRILFRQICFALGLHVAASVGLLGLGGWLVTSQELTFGQLVAAELIVTLVVSNLLKLGKYLETFYDLLAAADKLGHVLDLPTERPGGDEPAAGSGPVHLRFNLAYAYPSHPPVIDGRDDEIPAGARVALIGPRGCGKSTLIDLIIGVRAPSRGYVEYDGTDLRDLRLESVREQIGVVHTADVFEGTVVENLCVGREGLTNSDLREALATVGLLDDILELPDGMQTPLTTGRAPLSLGQSLRLVLARAIAGRPRLLILDGTLDYLDEPARGPLVKVIFRPDAPWTLIVVTRRPDVARLCDHTMDLESL